MPWITGHRVTEAAAETAAEFWDRMAALPAAAVAVLEQERAIDARLALIVFEARDAARSRDWQEARSATTARRARAVIVPAPVSERTLVKRVAARRQYVDDRSWQALPAPAVRPVEPGVKDSDELVAALFFQDRALDPRRQARVERDTATVFAQWSLCHPYGPAATADDGARWRALVDTLRPRGARRPRRGRDDIAPAGMSIARALEIAAAALSAKDA